MRQADSLISSFDKHILFQTGPLFHLTGTCFHLTSRFFHLTGPFPYLTSTTRLLGAAHLYRCMASAQASPPTTERLAPTVSCNRALSAPRSSRCCVKSCCSRLQRWVDSRVACWGGEGGHRWGMCEQWGEVCTSLCQVSSQKVVPHCQKHTTGLCVRQSRESTPCDTRVAIRV